MVVGRIWNFVKRHKKKFIFGGVVIGGSYCAYRYALPKIQEMMMQRLLKELADPDALKELTGGDESRRQRRARFRHQQRVSDRHAQRALDQLRARHNGCFTVEECQERLQKAQTPAAKLEAFNALQVECLGRLASAVYTFHVLLLLHRVEFNIIGRVMSANTQDAPPKIEEIADDAGTAAADKDADAHATFLESSRYLEEEGVKRIAHCVRTAVRACAEQRKLAPSTKITAEDLERFISDVCRDVTSELLVKGDAVATFLPASLDPSEEAEREKVKPFLDEARDYLESAQFRTVVQAVTLGAAKQLVGRLADDAADPSKAPLGGGRAAAVGRLFGPFLELSTAALSADENDDGLAALFAKEPLVDELCEGLYFTEDEKDLKGCPQQ